MKISIRQLQAFEAVARLGTVSNAAIHLSMTQPAVSQSIKELEQLLGTTLFDRVGRRLQLNDQGIKRLTDTRTLLNLVRQIEQPQESSEMRGVVRLSASTTIGNYLMPELMGQFCELNPQVEFQLNIVNTQGVVDDLLHMRSELGFIEGICQHKDIQVTPWIEDELVVFVNPQHPLANAAEVSLDALRPFSWILREPGSGTREVFENAASSLLGHITIALELSRQEAVKRSVLAGLGVGCLSKRAVIDEHTRGDLVILKTPLSLQRSFYKLEHQRYSIQPAAQAFGEFCDLQLQTVNGSF